MEFRTNLIFSENALAYIIDLSREKELFIIADLALKDQNEFSLLNNLNSIYWFDATSSEPKTSDVDYLKSIIFDLSLQPDVIVGIGGGSTMDLAKATAIVFNNKENAEYYQGWGIDLNKGIDCYTVPTLNGTGAELTQIAVLRGSVRKLGINHPFVAPHTAIIDYNLSKNVKKNDRWYTMIDCFFHNYEIIVSRTSSYTAQVSAKTGLDLCRNVLSIDLSHYSRIIAETSMIASLCGGFASIGGRVGACHAISYGLSAVSSIHHSKAVVLSMLALEDLYPDVVKEVKHYININNINIPSAKSCNIFEEHLDKMVAIASEMKVLWESHFGTSYARVVNKVFLEKIYLRILSQ